VIAKLEKEEAIPGAGPAGKALRVVAVGAHQVVTPGGKKKTARAHANESSRKNPWLDILTSMRTRVKR
jgi:hypothetical protein